VRTQAWHGQVSHGSPGRISEPRTFPRLDVGSYRIPKRRLFVNVRTLRLTCPPDLSPVLHLEGRPRRRRFRRGLFLCHPAVKVIKQHALPKSLETAPSRRGDWRPLAWRPRRAQHGHGMTKMTCICCGRCCDRPEGFCHSCVVERVRERTREML